MISFHHQLLLVFLLSVLISGRLGPVGRARLERLQHLREEKHLPTIIHSLISSLLLSNVTFNLEWCDKIKSTIHPRSLLGSRNY